MIFARLAFVLLITVFVSARSISVSADSVVTLNYQRDAGGATVDQNYILIDDSDVNIVLQNPVATLLLFVGGRGRLRIDDGQLSVSATNFLLRTRHHFASRGQFNVAVMDAASDFLDTNLFPDGLNAQRLTAEHLEDMKRVIADLRARFPNLPVCVVGTSRGSISAAHVAASLLPLDGPECAVLTSSVTVDRPNRNSLNDVVLEDIQVPTLIVSHRKDACQVTPPSDAIAIFKSLTSAPKRKLMFISGGFQAISDECNALSAHGFFGVESVAVNRISRWIRNSQN